MMRKVFFRFCLLQFLLLGSLFGKESLFLRAKGPYRDLQGEESETQKEFDIGNGDFEKGEFVYAANPTLDLMFKLLFLGGDLPGMKGKEELISKAKAQERVRSLLNSLYHPESEIDENAEHIVEVEVIDEADAVSVMSGVNVGKPKKRKLFDWKDILSELMGGILCKCTVVIPNEKRQENRFYVMYFQNGYPSCEKELAEECEEGDVQRVVFANYETEEIVSRTIQIVIVNGSSEEMDKEMFSRVPPAIGLKKAVEVILSGEEIAIVQGKEIGNRGKEWLKLLGLQWWAPRSKRKGTYEMVPADVSCDEIRESLEILGMDGIDELAFRREEHKIFNSGATFNAIRKEGFEKRKRIGQLKRIATYFISQKQIPDFMVSDIKKCSFKESFVKKFWKNLSAKEDVKGETLENFTRALEEKGLMKK